jgi:hypothetical protein
LIGEYLIFPVPKVSVSRRLLIFVRQGMISSSLDATFTSSVDSTFTPSVDATFTPSVDATFTPSVDATFTWMKRLFVYSAVTLFDTTNTSIETVSFGGAGSGVFGLVSFDCRCPRSDSLGVSLLFSGRNFSSSNKYGGI